MKQLFRAFLCGVAFMLGVAGIGASIVGLHAAQLSLFTGPAGSNPAQNPTILGDLNALVNLINQNAAFAGTNSPSNVVGADLITTSTIRAGSNALGMLQFMGNVLTTTTNTAGTCRITGATACIGVLDNNSVLRWIPVN